MTTLKEDAPEAFGVLKEFVVVCYGDGGEYFMDLHCEVCEQIAASYEIGAHVIELLDDLVEHVEKACKGPSTERPALRIVS